MQKICAECGGVFPVEETIRFGDVHVCAGCKPVFMQKLSEGAAVTSTNLRYGGFWIRFLAVVIDGIILGVFRLVLGWLTGFRMGQVTDPADFSLVMTQLIVTSLISMVINIIYEAYFVGTFGASVGKMACGLRVVTANGGRVSAGLAVGRAFAKQLSGITLLIGYIMAAFDSEKRSLHDRICDTRVIRK